MFKQLSVFFLLATLAACSAPQEPIFKQITNFKSSGFSTKKITITADAIYHNPNSLGGELTAIDIKVEVNGIPDVATVVQTDIISIPTRSEFIIPLTFDIAPRDIYEKDRNGVIGGLLSAALSRKVKLHYRGNVRMKIAGIPYTLPVDYEEEVSL